MTKRALNFNSQTGTGQEQIHAATGGISVCRRTQTPGAWVHAARPPRGRSTAQWLLCLVCRRRISKSGRRMKGLVLSVCISLSVHSVSPGRGKHFILHFYAQPRASPAFQHCVCDCLNVEYYSFQHVCTCTSQENNSKPTPNVQHDGYFIPNPAPNLGGIWFKQRARAWSKPQSERTYSLTPESFSWGSVLNYSQSLLLKKIPGHGLQPTKPLTWNTAY